MGAPFRKRRYLTWKPLGIHVPALSFRGFSVGMIDRGLRSGPLHCRLRAWRAYTTTKDGGALKTQQENGRKNRGLRLSFFFLQFFPPFCLLGFNQKKKITISMTLRCARWKTSQVLKISMYLGVLNRSNFWGFGIFGWRSCRENLASCQGTICCSGLLLWAWFSRCAKKSHWNRSDSLFCFSTICFFLKCFPWFCMLSSFSSFWEIFGEVWCIERRQATALDWNSAWHSVKCRAVEREVWIDKIGVF